MSKDKYIALEDKYKSLMIFLTPWDRGDWEDEVSAATIRSFEDIIPTTDAKSIVSENIIKKTPNSKSVACLSYGLTYPSCILFFDD